MVTFFIAVFSIAFFILGLSITLIRKGRNLQGDVGENDEMRKRGLECTSQAIRREEAELRGTEYVCTDGDCGSCSTKRC